MHAHLHRPARPSLSIRVGRCILFFMIWAAATTIIPAQVDEDNSVRDAAPGDDRIDIAIWYRGDGLGVQQRDGIVDACEELDCRTASNVSLHEFPYDLEPDGFRVLQQAILNDGGYDLVIGPTDSGVFLRATQLLEWHDNGRVPIISPVVIATTESGADTESESINTPESWFFATNVGAAARAEAMANFMERRKAQSVAVIYADSDFARLSEAALRARFARGSVDEYISYRFADLSDARRGVDEIIALRPSGVGIIALREEISSVLDELNQRNDSWNTYRPTLFTVIDARNLHSQGLYFPSLVAPGSNGRGEVYALARDTMNLVLRLIDSQPNGEFSIPEFRADFSALMSGPPERPQPRSGMKFNNYRNEAQLWVQTVRPDPTETSDEEYILSPAQLRGSMTFAQSIEHELLERLNRFGPKVVINILLLALIVAYLTVLDLQKWYTGTKRSAVWRWPFLLLLAFNLLTAALLYIFLAETGQIRWDNTLAAVIVAVGYSALLKSTLFKTQAGVDIGLEKLYDGAVSWLNQRIMYARSRRESPYIYFVAYRNHVRFMKQQLVDVYRFAKTEQTSKELIAALEARLDSESKLIDKRRVCAEKLLSLMSWRELQARHIVPPNVSRHDVINPEILIAISVDHVFKTCDDPKAWLLDQVNALIDSDTNTARKQQVQKALEAELKASTTTQSDVYTLVRWLFLHYAGRNTLLLKAGLLPEDYLERATGGFRQRLREWFGFRAQTTDPST